MTRPDINARYVCNCLINKLLNELATRFNCLDSLKVNSREPNGKRSRSQAYANYILNLSCPRSHYDLSFEPSKTSVEFKVTFVLFGQGLIYTACRIIANWSSSLVLPILFNIPMYQFEFLEWLSIFKHILFLNKFFHIWRFQRISLVESRI